MTWRTWVSLVCATSVLWSVVPARALAGEAPFSVVVEYADGHLETVQEYAANASAALEQAQQRTQGVHVELDVAYHLALVPNDPLFAAQVQLEQIGAPAAWDTRTDAGEVIVAVLDSGVDTSNPELASNLWVNPREIAGNGVDDDSNGYTDDVNGWNFVEDSADPRPQITEGATAAGLHHGTVVAGIIGAEGNNGVGVVGVTWNVQILPVRVLDSTGSGTTVTVAEGIRYATAVGADVINLSFVGSGVSPTLANAISAAQAAGVVIVAAAGNENLDVDTTPQYPVCYSGVIGVGSVNASDVKSSFSNYGSCVDIVAPGENVTSTLLYAPASGHTSPTGGGWYGTSVASPFVSGAAALIRASMPNASVENVEQILKSHAVSIAGSNPGFGDDLGAGRLSVSTLVADATVVAANRVSILTIPRAGDSPRVREYSDAGKVLQQFYGAPQKLQNGAMVRSGDVNGDGSAEVVTATLQGSDARVRTYSRTGQQLKSFLVFPSTYRGGVSLAVGDVTGDGAAEIVVGTQLGSSQIRVFSGDGALLGQFFAFTKQYRGGVSLAVGDLNADGVNEVLVAKRAGEARISAYTFAGKLTRSFLAFPRTYRSGVTVAVGDVTGDGQPDVVVGAVQGSPTVRVLSASGVLIRNYSAYDRAQTGGVSVAVGDVDGDGIAEILTGTGPGAKPEVRVWRKAGQQRSLLFNAYTSVSRTGIDVSVLASI